MNKLKESELLWEKSEKKTSATGVATANVTSKPSSRGDETAGIASNQNNTDSDDKGIEKKRTCKKWRDTYMARMALTVNEMFMEKKILINQKFICVLKNTSIILQTNTN